jgi:FkbM family methyltransferase
MTESFSSPSQLPRPKELIRSWRSSASASLMELTQKVWRGECENDVWILGRNEAAKILLSKGLSCAGIIDDFTHKTAWNGVPIQRFDLIASQGGIVINCVQCNQSVEASQKIASSSNLIGLSFADFYRASLLNEDSLPIFSKRTHDVIGASPDLYESLWEDLSDESSRQTFTDVLRYRFTTDPAYLIRYSYRPNEQYFEGFLKFSEPPTFVDAGAFKGETSLEFAKRYPNYRAIHAFEPSAPNADCLIKQTVNLHNFQLHRVGLSDKADIVRFASSLGSASRVAEEGDVAIKMIRLDELNLSFADLIKMDLEGGEYKALLGGEQTIRRCKSRLAVAAYHDPMDFAVLHHLMSKIIPGSSFYIRHYTSGWAETVLYCVP